MNNSLYNDNKTNSFNKFYGKHLHFIGIGGVSMSGIARLSLSLGCSVSGSDKVYSERLDTLRDLGIDAYDGISLDRVEDSDVVIYSGAVPCDDRELSYARALDIETMERSEYLSYLMSLSSVSIGIAGTHGKSTTTALIGHILDVAGMNNTCHVGADAIDNLSRDSIGNIFIAEACEYRRSFLKMSPSIGVVLNIDYDHPDEYKTLDELYLAFEEFRDNSEILISHESTGLGGITYGVGDNVDYRIGDIEGKLGKYSFTITHEDETIRVTSRLYGKHNINNITASYIVADMLNVKKKDILKGISTFSGLHRRYEHVGRTENGATIIHDYAHHPEEIKRAIALTHELTEGKVVVVFEPHTYSRTKSLIEGFMDAFYWADDLILLPTYPARETEDMGYTTLELIEVLKSLGEFPLYFDSYKRAEKYLVDNTSSRDIILVLGAGSVDTLASDMKKD